MKYANSVHSSKALTNNNNNNNNNISDCFIYLANLI